MMPSNSISSCLVRFCHGLCSFAVLYALLYFKTDLQEALLYQKDVTYAVTFLGLFSFSLLMYYTTCFMDPGFVRMSSHHKIIYEDQSAETDFTGVQLRHCGFCGIKQPLRARHCEDCHRCIHKFDHHCPWLDTCIGERNHRWFYLFLLSETALTFWTLVIASRALVYRVEPVLWLKLNYVLLTVIIFVTCSFVSSLALALMHTYVMVFNVTTWEFVSRRRITYLKDLPWEFNPFHQGILGNICRFLFSGCTYNWAQTYVRNTSIAEYYTL